MRRKILILYTGLILAFIGLIIFSFPDYLARFVWQKYHWQKTALLLDRSDANLAMFIGNYYFNGVIGGGEYNLDIAERAYEKAVSINPKILWGHYQSARIYFIKGNFNGALEEINTELQYNPANLRSLYVRGLIYGYSGNLAGAETDFRNFVEWAPKEWAGYNDLAWVLSEDGKYREAESAIKLAFGDALDAKANPWLWNSLGVAELNLKEYSSAKTSFGKAKELAAALTPGDWRRAYPGNGPGDAVSGLSAFRAAIEENIKRSGNAAVN